MRPAILLFPIYLLGLMSLQAQTNFLKGYYITTSQDTVHGYVDYRSERRNYKLCVFKKTLSDKVVRFYPQDIVGFGVENKDLYVRQSFGNRKGETLDGFFRVVVRGKLTLLRYQSRYFVKATSGKLQEITKRNEVSDRKIREDFAGLGVLKFLMNDCAEISGAYLEEEYKSTANFSKIFKKYNSCFGSSSGFEAQKIKIKSHLDVGIQMSPVITDLDLSGILGDPKLGSDYSFSGGAFASIFLPKVNEKARLLLEANYGKSSHYAYFSSSSINNDLFVDYTYLKAPIFIRYSFNKFFIDLGMQNQLILNQNTKWRVETILQNTVLTSERSIPAFNSWTYGYMAGFGTKYMVANHAIRSSMRFSQTRVVSHVNKPIFQTIELCFSIQLMN